jgi:hypothetical protein
MLNWAWAHLLPENLANQMPWHAVGDMYLPMYSSRIFILRWTSSHVRGLPDIAINDNYSSRRHTAASWSPTWETTSAILKPELHLPSLVWNCFEWNWETSQRQWQMIEPSLYWWLIQGIYTIWRGGFLETSFRIDGVDMAVPRSMVMGVSRRKPSGADGSSQEWERSPN